MDDNKLWNYKEAKGGTTLARTWKPSTATSGRSTNRRIDARNRWLYIVVDTGHWIFGKKRLLPAGLIERFDPTGDKVYVTPPRTRSSMPPTWRKVRPSTMTPGPGAT